MLSKQFLLATTKPDHPNHADLNKPLPRKMKETLTSKYKDDITALIPDQGTDISTYRTGIQRIHTESVANTITNQTNNLVLNYPAPPVNKLELNLPRNTRVKLSQLRSGYSSHLNSYLHRINPTKYPTPNCPDCNTEPHTTTHLFNCREKPTNLQPHTLWTDPETAAAFLGLETREGVG